MNNHSYTTIAAFNPSDALPIREIGSAPATHQVSNQPPVFEANLFEIDPALKEAIDRAGASWAQERLLELGAEAGSIEVQHLARQANRFPPELETHDRFGNRCDLVFFHPAYHDLMRRAFGAGVHSLAWTEAATGTGHVARAALNYIWQQAENGVCCMTAMAYAAVPTLRKEPRVAAIWEPAVLSTEYDPDLGWIERKRGATIGMAMTEKQGGSDLRANDTRAARLGPTDLGEEYAITGHKWFCSAPMSDAFLTLAQTDKGISCFLVPRTLPNGDRNVFRIQRLKDKLGNKSNASCEIEYEQTRAVLIGEQGRGIPTILEMAHLTRLDVAIGSAGIMRRALVEALHHTRNRRAFQRTLVDQPLMNTTLADLAIESEAAMTLGLRAAQAVDGSSISPTERRLARILVPVAKLWNCKRAPSFVGEALECLGGNGFVETSIMPRLYREAPLNGLWEGSANVIGLDILRAFRRDPEIIDAVMAELRISSDHHSSYDALVEGLPDLLRMALADESIARRLASNLALAFQACSLIRFSPNEVSNAFCCSRIDSQNRGYIFGSFSFPDREAILERAMPR
ncbi:putative acyl-CoA dehydrogenase [Bradyrhizobium japonicum]